VAICQPSAAGRPIGLLARATAGGSSSARHAPRQDGQLARLARLAVLDGELASQQASKLASWRAGERGREGSVAGEMSMEKR